MDCVSVGLSIEKRKKRRENTRYQVRKIYSALAWIYRHWGKLLRTGHCGYQSFTGSLRVGANSMACNTHRISPVFWKKSGRNRLVPDLNKGSYKKVEWRANYSCSENFNYFIIGYCHSCSSHITEDTYVFSAMTSLEFWNIHVMKYVFLY